MWKFLFLFISCGYVYAMTDEEGKQNFIKILMTCTKDHPVEMSDLLKLEQLAVPTKREVKCLLACSYRKMGTLDSKGMYDIKQGYKYAEMMKNGDEKRLENGKKIADICVKVNEETVSDGEKGCDRAALMFKCLLENAPKLGFKL